MWEQFVNGVRRFVSKRVPFADVFNFYRTMSVLDIPEGTLILKSVRRRKMILGLMGLRDAFLKGPAAVAVDAHSGNHNSGAFRSGLAISMANPIFLCNYRYICLGNYPHFHQNIFL